MFPMSPIPLGRVQMAPCFGHVAPFPCALRESDLIDIQQLFDPPLLADSAFFRLCGAYCLFHRHLFLLLSQFCVVICLLLLFECIRPRLLSGRLRILCCPGKPDRHAACHNGKNCDRPDTNEPPSPAACLRLLFGCKLLCGLSFRLQASFFGLACLTFQSLPVTPRLTLRLFAFVLGSAAGPEKLTSESEIMRLSGIPAGPGCRRHLPVPPRLQRLQRGRRQQIALTLAINHAFVGQRRIPQSAEVCGRLLLVAQPVAEGLPLSQETLVTDVQRFLSTSRG